MSELMAATSAVGDLRHADILAAEHGAQVDLLALLGLGELLKALIGAS